MRLLWGALLLGWWVPALAQPDPLSGVSRYPEFRNFSGLAGSLYGVDSQGYRSLSGPVALSSPVAHVLGRSHLEIGGGNMSFNSSPEFRQGPSNSTIAITYGHTIERVNIAFSEFLISEALNQAWNLQAS